MHVVYTYIYAYVSNMQEATLATDEPGPGDACGAGEIRIPAPHEAILTGNTIKGGTISDANDPRIGHYISGPVVTPGRTRSRFAGRLCRHYPPPPPLDPNNTAGRRPEKRSANKLPPREVPTLHNPEVLGALPHASDFTASGVTLCFLRLPAFSWN